MLLLLYRFSEIAPRSSSHLASPSFINYPRERLHFSLPRCLQFQRQSACKWRDLPMVSHHLCSTHFHKNSPLTFLQPFVYHYDMNRRLLVIFDPHDRCFSLACNNFIAFHFRSSSSSQRKKKGKKKDRRTHCLSNELFTLFCLLLTTGSFSFRLKLLPTRW